jgi:HK97 family phage portal protein
MSLLRRLFVPEARDVNTIAELLAKARGITWSGTSVTPDTAMRHAAVWECVDLLSELLSTLPIDVFRTTADGTRQPLPLPPLLRAPTPAGSRISWMRQYLTSMLLRGNAFGLVQARDQLGYPTALEWLSPDRIRLQRAGRTGPIRYVVDGGRALDPYPEGPIVHRTGYEIAGSPAGLSVIEYARQQIGLGLSAEEFAARWFGDGAHPSAVLESDQKIDADDAKIVKVRFVDAIRGKREPAVLGLGLRYRQVQISPEESQFLDTIQANRAMIAGWFRLPPEAIGAATSGSSVTYANREQRALDLLTYALQPWIVRTDEMLTGLLPRPQFVKINVNGLLRVDALTRWRIHDIAVRLGVHSRDEVRRLEDEPPLPDGEQGDVHLWPPYATNISADLVADAGGNGT